MSDVQMLDMFTQRYEALCAAIHENGDIADGSSKEAEKYSELIAAFNELGGMFEALLSEVSDNKRLISVMTTALASSQRQVALLEWQRDINAVQHCKTAHQNLDTE